jgi:hypothetical protein
MKSLHMHQTVERDGEIHLTGLPCHRGQAVELTVLIPTRGKTPGRRALTARALLGSGLVGLWRARPDVTDASAFARRLRSEVTRRNR